MSPEDAAWVGERLAFYAEHLRRDVLAWWLKHAVDDRHGGVFTYWNGTGTTLKSTNKYVWSQGRWVWTMSALSRLAQDRPDLDLDAAAFAAEALRSGTFLRRSALLADGTCASVVTREGTPLEAGEETGLHDSVYSDLFVALGFSGLARQEASGGWGEEALRLLTDAAGRIVGRTARTAPYAVPEAHQAFALHMILLHTAAEVHAATGDEAAATIAAGSAFALRRVFSNDADICELKPDDPVATQGLFARHRNPGHAIEGLWMYSQAAEQLPRVRAIDPAYMAWLVASLDHMCRLGWDEEQGGLFRFVDRDGGPPRGVTTGSPYEGMVAASWDWKLWWPHNEALYAALLLWVRTGSPSAREWFRRIDDYTFSHFPAGPGNEWSQILDRSGRPLDPDARAALPVKDPFHLTRSLILLISLSSEVKTATRRDEQ